jgi:hypothetical protein
MIVLYRLAFMAVRRPEQNACQACKLGSIFRYLQAYGTKEPIRLLLMLPAVYPPCLQYRDLDIGVCTDPRACVELYLHTQCY